MDAEEHGGGGEDGASIAGGDEGVRFPRLLEPEPNHDAGVRLLPDGGERLFGHADDIRGGHDLDSAPIEAGVSGQFRLDDLDLPHELHNHAGQERECGKGTLDLSVRGVISAHRVQRHADHAQSPLTSTTFFPR